MSQTPSLLRVLTYILIQTTLEIATITIIVLHMGSQEHREGKNLPEVTQPASRTPGIPTLAVWCPSPCPLAHPDILTAIPMSSPEKTTAVTLL